MNKYVLTLKNSKTKSFTFEDGVDYIRAYDEMLSYAEDNSDDDFEIEFVKRKVNGNSTVIYYEVI